MVMMMMLKPTSIDLNGSLEECNGGNRIRLHLLRLVGGRWREEECNVNAHASHYENCVIWNAEKWLEG